MLGMTPDKKAKYRKLNKIGIIAIGIIGLLVIIIAVSGGGSDNTGSSTNSSSKAAASTASGKTTFEAVLWDGANNDNTPMTLPSAGWDANDGWDTEAGLNVQLQEAQNGDNNVIMPAVIAKNDDTLELHVNVHNTGSNPGTPSCTVKASSNPTNFEQAVYFGVTSVNIPSLNGGNVKPGDYISHNVDITISNHGAQNIKAISISCL